MKGGQIEKERASLALIPSPESLSDGGRTHTQIPSTHKQFETSLAEIRGPEQDGWLFSSIKHPLNKTQWVVCGCV